MGVAEWIALITLAAVLLGHIIKVSSDKAETETKVKLIETWKDRMEEGGLLTHAQFDKNRSECQAQVFRDLNRVERRSDELVRILEEQNRRINGIDNNVAKILAVLEKSEYSRQ